MKVIKQTMRPNRAVLHRLNPHMSSKYDKAIIDRTGRLMRLPFNRKISSSNADDQICAAEFFSLNSYIFLFNQELYDLK